MSRSCGPPMEVEPTPPEGLTDDELVRIWASVRKQGVSVSRSAHSEGELWDDAAQDIAVRLLEMRRDGTLPENPAQWAQSQAKHRRRAIQWPERVMEKDADGQSRRVRTRREQPVAPVADPMAAEGTLSPLARLCDRPMPPDEEELREREEAEAQWQAEILGGIVAEATAAGRTYSQAVLEEWRTGVRVIHRGRFKEEKDRLVAELKRRLAAHRAAEDLFLIQPA